MAKKKALKVGDTGTYNGVAVEVTKVHEDGALDLQATGPNTGRHGDGTPATNANPAWYERVSPDLFELGGEPEPEPEPAAV